MRRLASLLPIATLRQRAIAEARELTERWDVPLSVTVPGTDKPVPVPFDLADRVGRFHRTRDGFRISGRLLLDDVRIGSESPVVPLLIAANAVLGGLAVLLALLPHLWPLAAVLGIAAVGVAVLARQGGQVAAHAGVAAVWSALLGAITTALLIGDNPAHTPGAAMVMGIVPAAATVALGLAVAIALLIALGFLLDLGQSPPAPDSKSPRSPSAVATVAISAATGLRAARAYVLQVVVVAALLLAGTWIGGITGWAIALLSLLPAAASGWAHSSALTWERARQLLGQSAFYCGEDFGPNPNSTATARAKQAVAAVQDTTPWLPLGVASGHLSSNCSDFFAPDENMPFGLTIRDLATHLAVFGTTGTGKTSGVLRPLINAWIENKAGGVLLLDGKASLPAEFRNRNGYILLDPANLYLRVALFEGLAPEDVSAAVQSAVPRDHSEGSGFFTSSASMLLTHALVLLRLFVDDEMIQSIPDEARVYRWSPVGLATLIAQMDRPEPPQDGMAHRVSALARPLLALCERVDASTRAVLDDPETTEGMAGKFVLGWFDQDDRTRSNIRSTLDTWLNPLALHPLLLPWASAEHGVDPTAVLRGAAMGILLPETTYGDAGRMTSALIRARLYKALRERSDLSAAQQRDPAQTRCLMVIDEAQEVLTEADRRIVAVSRSLGLTFVIATQSVDALRERFSGGGGNEATALLDNFASLVALRSSPVTYEYVSARVGKGWSKQVTSSTASPAWQADLAAIASTAAFDPHHPHAAHYATLRRRLPRGLDHTDTYAIQPASVEWKQTDIVTAEDWTSRLAEPFVAIALLLRAGAPRRDYVVLKPQFPALAAPQPTP